MPNTQYSLAEAKGLRDEDGSGKKRLAALAESLGLIPSINIRTHNSSFRERNAFWRVETRHTCYPQTNMQAKHSYTERWREKIPEELATQWVIRLRLCPTPNNSTGTITYSNCSEHNRNWSIHNCKQQQLPL